MSRPPPPVLDELPLPAYDYGQMVIGLIDAHPFARLPQAWGLRGNGQCR
jgi:hypothetical protein